EFTKFSDGHRRGEEVGKRRAIGLAAGLAGPLVGGILIDTIGFSFVFVLASVLLFFSVIFLFFSKEVHEPFHFSIKAGARKETLRDGVVFIGRGMQTISVGVLWPMFIFAILKTYTNLGILGSAIGAVTSIMVLLVGRASDKVGKRKVIRVGVGLTSVTWFIRHLVINVSQVFGVSIFAGLAQILVGVPFNALEYDKAEQRKRGHLAEFFVWREMFICVGRVLVLLVVLLTGKFVYGFILTGFGNFSYLLF
ncbi:MFS transporter, partial [Candidatus Woesearchaeota archaeon]|nr:MFS transporter [Candidatus Woesearchaeota archaeon]